MFDSEDRKFSRVLDILGLTSVFQRLNKIEKIINRKLGGVCNAVSENRLRIMKLEGKSGIEKNCIECGNKFIFELDRYPIIFDEDTCFSCYSINLKEKIAKLSRLMDMIKNLVSLPYESETIEALVRELN